MGVLRRPSSILVSAHKARRVLLLLKHDTRVADRAPVRRRVPGRVSCAAAPRGLRLPVQRVASSTAARACGSALRGAAAARCAPAAAVQPAERVAAGEAVAAGAFARKPMAANSRATAQLSAEFVAKAAVLILDARVVRPVASSATPEKTNRWVRRRAGSAEPNAVP